MAAQPNQPARSVTAANELPPAPVLLVDDDPVSLLAVEAVLADLGADIVGAASAREALQRLHERDFALVILDVGLPDLDGFAAARLIRAQPRSQTTPIIFLTGRPGEAALYRAYDLGAVDYLLKPVVPAVLRAKVGAFVELHRQNGIIRRQMQELSAARDQLERSRAELAQFASIAAHDLKEPLRTIASFLQLLAEHLGDGLDEPAQQYLGFALDGARRLQRLIDGLLEYARLGMSEKPGERVAMQSLLAAVIAGMRAMIEGSHALVSVGPLPEVAGIPSRLEQLMQNLLANALKFVPHGSIPRVEIGSRRQGAQWQFWVRDHGIGFEPKHAERIFVPFQRLHTAAEYSGTGIGLALCKKIVVMHGGRIWVESAPGEGSTFYFTLPAADAAGEGAPSSDVHANANTK